MSWTRVGEESWACEPNGPMMGDALDHFILLFTGGGIWDSGLIQGCL